MQRLSELQVISHLLFQLPKREPIPYGPLDPRMVLSPHARFTAEVSELILFVDVLGVVVTQGVCNTKTVCATCGKKVDECAGHFGYIKLALPGMHSA